MPFGDKANNSVLMFVEKFPSALAKIFSSSLFFFELNIDWHASKSSSHIWNIFRISSFSNFGKIEWSSFNSSLYFFLIDNKFSSSVGSEKIDFYRKKFEYL